MMQPLSNVSVAYRLLIQEETQRSIVTIGETHVMAFAAEDRKLDSKVAVYKPPGIWNNKASNKGGYNGITRRNFYCEHYRMIGHTIDRC